jgi:protein TonB
MTVRQRRWLAASLATGLVLLLVLIASFDLSGNAKPPKRFVLTEATTFEPPPPPPPPPPPARTSNSPAGGSTGAQLTLRSSRAPLELDKMRLDIQFAAAEVGNLNIAGLGEGIGLGVGDGVGNGTGSGYGFAGVSELDQVPMVVSAPPFVYPKEAIERGLAEFDLKYHIMIDEQGRTYPIALVENPFPSLNAQLLAWAAQVRFSPPTRLGIPVKTEYVWPVRINRN